MARVAEHVQLSLRDGWRVVGERSTGEYDPVDARGFVVFGPRQTARQVSAIAVHEAV